MFCWGLAIKYSILSSVVFLEVFQFFLGNEKLYSLSVVMSIHILMDDLKIDDCVDGIMTTKLPGH